MATNAMKRKFAVLIQKKSAQILPLKRGNEICRRSKFSSNDAILLGYILALLNHQKESTNSASLSHCNENL